MREEQNKKEQQNLDTFRSAKVSVAVFQNAIPAMIAMLMVLIYNVADTFFIGQTHDALQVAAVSLCTPVFLLFMSVGTIFGLGGMSVISRTFYSGSGSWNQRPDLGTAGGRCAVAGFGSCIIYTEISKDASRLIPKAL